MALPVTIGSSNVGDQNSYHGAFKSSGGAFYASLVGPGGSTSECRVHKATDPTDSFTRQDSGTTVSFVNGILSQNTFQASNKLHVAGQNNADDVFYARFDMSTDTWDAIDGASDRDILIDGAPDGTADACDLVVRSDGDIVVVYQKEVDKVKGNPFERVGLSVSTSANRGETWSAVVRVDNQGSVERDMTGPRIALGDGDASHIVWKDDNTTPTMSQRALSSADALQTERTDVTGADDLSTALYSIGHGVSFDRSGTTKIRFLFEDNNPEPRSIGFDAAADPSTFSVQAVEPFPSRIVNNSFVGCLAVDGSTVHAMYSRASNSDLDTRNDQDSDTWSDRFNTFTGTINHVSCNVYIRGSDIVLAHIIDDGGTVKYDEDDIGDAATDDLEFAGTLGQGQQEPVREPNEIVGF